MEYLASILNMKKRDLTLVKGDKSSHKVVSLDACETLTKDYIKELLLHQR